MTIDDKIRNEKLQNDINRETAKISALTSGKIDKYEYPTGEKKILASDQRRVIEQAKFTYSPLGKAFEKQTKKIEKQGEKQIKALENRVETKFLDIDQNSIASLFSKNYLNEEATYELNKVLKMENNKKLNSVATELFVRGIKLNISLVFIKQSCFKVPKDVAHFYIMKIPNKREFQQIANNHTSDIDFKDFMNLYKKCNAKPYSFLVIDTTLASDNPSRFRKSLLERIIN